VGVAGLDEIELRQGARGSGASQPVEAGVDDDAVQPRGDRGITAIGAGATVGGQECLLHTVRCQLAIPGRPDGDCPHTVPVPPEELAEGIGLTQQVAADQLAIVALPQWHFPRHARPRWTM
jgi:hypothetical protein